MQIPTAVLCDFAGVREGLFTIVSGGITRLWREQLPGPLSVFVALHVELTPAESALPHELRIRLTAPSGKVFSEVRGAFQVDRSAASFDPEENVLFPIPIDMRAAPVEEWGWITFDISVDDIALKTLRVKVDRKRPPPVATMRPPRGDLPH